MTDQFSGHKVNLESPVENGEAVDISTATHTCTSPTRALWVGTGGDVVVNLVGVDGLTFKSVQDGTLLPIRVTAVVKAGTDASDMVAVW